MIDADPGIWLMTQSRRPSKAIEIGSETVLATTLEEPGGSAGSNFTTAPLPRSVTKTDPIAIRRLFGSGGLGQVSRTLPSLPRSRESVPPPVFATQTSVPSHRIAVGPVPTVVMETRPPVAPPGWLLRDFSTVRWLRRKRSLSTERDRKMAIWSRDTSSLGE